MQHIDNKSQFRWKKEETKTVKFLLQFLRHAASYTVKQGMKFFPRKLRVSIQRAFVYLNNDSQYTE